MTEFDFTTPEGRKLAVENLCEELNANITNLEEEACLVVYHQGNHFSGLTKAKGIDLLIFLSEALDNFEPENALEVLKMLVAAQFKRLHGEE